MLQQVRGIVLGVVKYNDTSSIIDMYTREVGYVSFWLPVSRTRKSGIRPVLFQALSLIEVVADLRPNSNIHRIKEARPWYISTSLPYDPFKSAIALFLAEFLGRVLRKEEENLSLFAYLTYSIQWLDSCSVNFANFHLVFLLRLSRFLGLYPNTECYKTGAYFDLLNGCYVTNLPEHSFFLNQYEAGVLYQLSRLNFRSMHLFTMSHSERNQCLDYILRYYQLHIPGFSDMKSLLVLKDLFV